MKTLRTLLSAATLALTLLLPTSNLLAKEAPPEVQDPVAEKRIQALSEELRCLVCQNQNIADSNADLAQDLRRELRGMIQAGKSDKEIIDFMVARYGDFVLYRPPVKGLTLMLWGGPAFLLLLGLIALFTYLRKRNQVVAEQRPLSEEENRRLSAMLADQADEAQKNNK
ncbi:MAG: hypothetical protein RIR00_137 [Pseudomonadota bacterium]|jgi:cytochrome c-type biogenesis protein CcmH